MRSTLITLVIACLAAFCYKAYKYRLRETFSRIVLLVDMFPQILILPPPHFCLTMYKSNY